MAHNGLGSVLFHQGNDHDAESEYRRALAIDPNFKEAHYNLGLVLYREGKHDDAIAAYRRSLAIDPNFELARRNLEWALSKKESIPQTIEARE
jgi:tetratricopeptide (TPR) repeat protein